MNPLIFGIDISYSQEDGKPPIDWDAVAESMRDKDPASPTFGQIIGFVYARVCYGTNPADDDGITFTRAHDECKRLGIPFGAYFFWLAGQDGAAQAQHFLSAASGRYGTLRPVIDVEEGSGAEGWLDTVGARTENLAACSNAIRTHLDCVPMLYTNDDTWEAYFNGTDAFAGHKLYVASYSDPAGSPAVPRGFQSWAMHQYSSTGSIPGISGNVDLDAVVSLEDIAR